MSSEIIIFQAPEESEQSVKDHHEIEQEKLLGDLGQENFIHVDFLLDMVNKLSAEKSFWITSNILSIIAKQILLYCYPIIKEVPNTSLTEQKESDSEFFIQVQLNYDVKAFLLPNKETSITVPAETPFRIVGFRTSKLFLPHLDYSTIGVNHPILTDVRELFRSGSYSYELNRKNINNVSPYVQQLIPIINDDYSIQSKFENKTFTFTNKEEAKDTMDKILAKILLAREYYEKFLPFFIITKIPKTLNYKSELVAPENTIPAELKDTLFYPYSNKFGLKEKLMGENLFVLYNKLKKQGLSNSDVQDGIKNKQIENKIKRQRILQEKDLSMQIVNDFRKQAIINRKFPNKDFKSLKEKEKEIVLREFELLNKKAKFIRDKTIRSAVHAFLKSFEAVNTAELLQQHYDNIRALIKDKNISALDIGLCDHHMEHAEIMLRMYKDKSIYKSRSAYEIRELLISKFTTAETLIDDEYYCKICGQLIASDEKTEVAEYSGEQRLNTGPEFDPLEELIYRDVSHIIRTYIKFKNLVDIRPIIKTMTASLTPEMHIIETKLKQIQTNISDDMRDLMGMYIYIYVFALVSHMIYVNYGQITFAFREGALGGGSGSPFVEVSGGDENQSESGKERLQNILKNALYLINSTKIKMLKSSTNIGSDKVKPILLQAYQWVLKLQTYRNVETKDQDIDYDILNSVVSSSIYQYLLAAQQIVQPKTDQNDLMKVIGTDLATIKKNNYKTKQDKINPFRSAVAISEKDWKKTGNSYYDEYTYGSYLEALEYEKKEIYNQFVTPPSDQLRAHYENEKKLLQIERRLRFQSRFAIWGAFNVIKRSFHYKNADKMKYNVGKYYRPDGSKRNWNIMVLSDDMEVNYEDLMKIEFSKRFALKVKDRKDGNEYLSEIKDYSVAINEKFEQQDYNKSLLEYFENRCPSGGIHEFTGSNICVKCARDMDAKWIYSAESDKYVKLHSAAFNKHAAFKLGVVKQNLEYIKKITKPYEFKFIKFPNWVSSEVQILEWSRVNSKINVNMLLNLGCSEHRKYVLIEKERDNPIKSYKNTEHLGRISKLDAYYNTTIRDYYSVKNYQLSDILPLFYKDLIEKYKIDILKLPDLDDIEYDKKLDWYKIVHVNENHLVCNFILVQLANMIIAISKIGVAGRALAELLTFSLIHKDRLLSKPDPFKITIDKRTKDDEYQSDTSSEGSDVDDEINVEASAMSEAESDVNEQAQDTEAYNFNLDDTGIDDLNDGNDDDEGGTEA